MSREYPRRCIYCRNDRPPSKEHVLPYSLGGDLTTLSDGTERPTVCKGCNQSFSTIDQALAEQFLTAISRAAYTKSSSHTTRVGGSHFHYDSEENLWLEAQLVNEMRSHLPPQLHHVKDYFNFFGSREQDKDSFVKVVDSRQVTGRLLRTFIRTDNADKATTPRVVQHRSNDLYVRAKTHETGIQFLELLDRQWNRIKEQLQENKAKHSTIERPSIEAHLKFRLNDTFRAVAKITFNYLAAKKGTELALSTEFDEIRSYICGDNVIRSKLVKSGQLAVDTRFVQMRRDAKPIIPTRAHAVALFYDPPALVGLVALYGEWSFVVQLGHIALKEGLFFDAHEFSIDRTGNKALEHTELAKRMRRSRDGST
ncbi:HNH endonuclease [Sorangium sp. So ce887]|uniref:HNH endonuclease n=1 Tax=Sorangium sp. So ce887 TaxID=3133324 RepID=UPI003F62A6C2